ncbi:MAG: hypothetical protein V8S08_03450 [Lachnoclostridium sp.]
MILLNCENLNPVIFDRLQLLTKNPTYRSKWEIIRAMPEAHYCGKSVGNSSAQTAETIVNTGSLPHRRHFAVADEKYFNHYIFPPEMPRFALFYALFWISSRITVFRKL